MTTNNQAYMQAYMKEYRLKNHQRILKQMKEYSLKHRESIREAQRKWSREHPEYQRKWSREHRESIREYQRKWSREHHEAHRKWCKEHREIMNVEQQAQRHVPLGPCCELCGSTEDLQRAHFDYALPFMVLTFCQKCHNRIDAYLRRLKVKKDAEKSLL